MGPKDPGLRDSVWGSTMVTGTAYNSTCGRVSWRLSVPLPSKCRMEERTSVLLHVAPLPRLLIKPRGGHGPFCQASSTWHGRPEAAQSHAHTSFHFSHTLLGHKIPGPVHPTSRHTLQAADDPCGYTLPPCLLYQADKPVDVQPLIAMGLEDPDNQAIQQVPLLLQASALFILHLQVCLRWDKPHAAPPWPGFLSSVSNLEHP